MGGALAEGVAAMDLPLTRCLDLCLRQPSEPALLGMVRRLSWCRSGKAGTAEGPLHSTTYTGGFTCAACAKMQRYPVA